MFFKVHQIMMNKTFDWFRYFRIVKLIYLKVTIKKIVLTWELKMNLNGRKK
jgi:hypothetical protein